MKIMIIMNYFNVIMIMNYYHYENWIFFTTDFFNKKNAYFFCNNFFNNDNWIFLDNWIIWIILTIKIGYFLPQNFLTKKRIFFYNNFF